MNVRQARAPHGGRAVRRRGHDPGKIEARGSCPVANWQARSGRSNLWRADETRAWRPRERAVNSRGAFAAGHRSPLSHPHAARARAGRVRMCASNSLRTACASRPRTSHTSRNEQNGAERTSPSSHAIASSRVSLLTSAPRRTQKQASSRIAARRLISGVGGTGRRSAGHTGMDRQDFGWSSIGAPPCETAATDGHVDIPWTLRNGDIAVNSTRGRMGRRVRRPVRASACRCVSRDRHEDGRALQRCRARSAA